MWHYVQFALAASLLYDDTRTRMIGTLRQSRIMSLQRKILLQSYKSYVWSIYALSDEGNPISISTLLCIYECRGSNIYFLVRNTSDESHKPRWYPQAVDYGTSEFPCFIMPFDSTISAFSLEPINIKRIN